MKVPCFTEDNDLSGVRCESEKLQSRDGRVVGPHIVTMRAVAAAVAVASLLKSDIIMCNCCRVIVNTRPRLQQTGEYCFGCFMGYHWVRHMRSVCGLFVRSSRKMVQLQTIIFQSRGRVCSMCFSVHIFLFFIHS